MDDVIASLTNHLEFYVPLLKKEWRNGKGEYTKFSDCPHYKDCKAIVNAIHVLEKAHYGEIRTMPAKYLVIW